jgi:hypothetical protein
MHQIIDERVPLVALRRSVFGFLIGAGSGVAIVAGVFALDVGSLATLASQAGGVRWFDLGLLPGAFALVGLVVGPAFGAASGDPGRS